MTFRLVDGVPLYPLMAHAAASHESPPEPTRQGGYASRAPVRERPPSQREVGPVEVAFSTVRKLGSLWASLARARWTEERLQRYQERRLRAMVQDTWTHVPLYRQLWSDAGVDPRAIQCVDDLRSLPIVEKDQVRDGFPEASLRSGFPLRRCRIQQTSGSSGQCMEIALSMRCDDMRNIMSQRIYGWNGFRWHNQVAYLFPYQLPFRNNLGIYRNTFLDATQPADQILDRLEAERFIVLAATPSDILELLEGLSPGRDPRKAGLQTLCLHSEPLSRDERSFFEETFGCPVRMNYYCNETWAIGAECEAGTMHQFMDNTILELVDENDEPVPDGTPGHVVATGLQNFVQPFIRYRLGDVVIRRKERGCECGRSFPILERVEGRDDDIFDHPDGRHIHPSKITVAVKSPCFAHPGLQVFRDFQIVQDSPAHVTVRLVAGRDDGPFDACAREGAANLKRLLAPDVEVDVRSEAEIPPGLGGKRKIFHNAVREANQGEG